MRVHRNDQVADVRTRRLQDTGTWDIGPFGNDTVADFGGDLDEAPLEQRESMIHGPLERAARPRGSPGCFRRRMAVAAAAAALVVAQHRDGEPACSKLRPSAPLSLPPPQRSPSTTVRPGRCTPLVLPPRRRPPETSRDIDQRSTSAPRPGWHSTASEITAADETHPLRSPAVTTTGRFAPTVVPAWRARVMAERR
ncbi:DUF4259 domain-containing protein [Streptomyces sp. NPDC058682]|uniref:DUF4259 domain-containing protein n=1 Tax=Streptomyces sp. NPDC058682 TaxID=3346596 RepID=UPI00364E79C9